MRRLCCLLVLASVLWGQRAADSILEPGRGWELIGRGYQLTADSAVDNTGIVYFTDARRNRIWKIDLRGIPTIWKANSSGTHGVAMGPDGRLYAGQHDRQRIVAYSPEGKETILAEGVQTHHLTVTGRNEVYFADAPNHKIWLLDAAGEKRGVSTALEWPHAMRVSPDQSSLIVTDSRAGSVSSLTIQSGGLLSDPMPACRLETSGKPAELDPGGIAFDRQGSLYVATAVGIQVCDRSGKVTETIRLPNNQGVTNVFFAGLDLAWLYATDGDRIFRRPVRRRGQR